MRTESHYIQPRLTRRLDFSDVKGQHSLRRTVEIAVSGHDLLMIGSPGSEIRQDPSDDRQTFPASCPDPRSTNFSSVSIHSAAGITLDAENRIYERPTGSPHHTISDAGLLGGSTIPGPGEISLARGVLFLDNDFQFKRSSLEVPPPPATRRRQRHHLPQRRTNHPALFGHVGRNDESLSVRLFRRPASRVSLHGATNPALSIQNRRSTARSHRFACTSATAHRSTPRHEAWREFGKHTRTLQTHTAFSKNACATQPTALSHCNARMSHARIRTHRKLSKAQGDLLQQAMEQLSLSAHPPDASSKLPAPLQIYPIDARSQAAHLLEAIQYRSLDRALFYYVKQPGELLIWKNEFF